MKSILINLGNFKEASSFFHKKSNYKWEYVFEYKPRIRTFFKYKWWIGFKQMKPLKK